MSCSFAVSMDLVDLPIPFLLARSAPPAMGAVLDFGASVIRIRHDSWIPIVQTKSGHISIPWIFQHCISLDSLDKHESVPIYSAENEQSEELSASDLAKLRVQFGHADTNTICPCNRSSGPGELPVVSRYLCEYPGQMLAMDTFFPHPTTSQEFTALIITDRFSKFVRARFLPNGRPGQYVKNLDEHWAIMFGFPKRILADRATSFGGPLWQSVCHAFDIELISAPTRAAHQIGLAERHVRIIKMSYNSSRCANKDNWNRQQILSFACIAKNATPSSGNNMSPNMIATGEDDLTNRYANVQHPTAWGTDNSIAAQQFRHLSSLMNLRAEIPKWDARFMTRIALTKSLRKGAHQKFEINRPVQVWSSIKRIWGNGFRLVAETGRNGIVERGQRLIKIPLICIRHKSDLAQIEEPSKETPLASENPAQNDAESTSRLDPSSSSAARELTPGRPSQPTNQFFPSWLVS